MFIFSSSSNMLHLDLNDVPIICGKLGIHLKRFTKTRELLATLRHCGGFFLNFLK